MSYLGVQTTNLLFKIAKEHLKDDPLVWSRSVTEDTVRPRESLRAHLGSIAPLTGLCMDMQLSVVLNAR
jgi:hypothetical protein